VSAARELTGLLYAIAWGCFVLAVMFAGPRGSWFFDDGDSVLMPMLKRSLDLHQPYAWAMSSVTFLFPEIPIYLGLAAIASGPRAALVLNAVLNIVLLYGVLRLIAQLLLRRGASSRLGMLAALAAIGTVVSCVLLERGTTQTSLQLVSMFFTTTYYYGAMLCLFVVVALAILALKFNSSRRVKIWSASGIAGSIAISTWSDPTTLFWLGAVVPIALGLLVLSHRDSWRTVLQLYCAIGCGFAAGILARVPFRRMIFQSVTGRVDLTAQRHAGGLLLAAVSEQILSLPGIIELVSLAALLVFTWLAFARLRAAGLSAEATFVSTVAALGPLILIVSDIAGGDGKPRHIQPIYFLPALSIVLVITRLRSDRGPRQRSLTCRDRAPSLRALAALVVCCAVVCASIVGLKVSAEASSAASSKGLMCLEDWIDGRNLQGVGGFWGARALLAYGSADVDLLQVTGGFASYLWLVNSAAYTNVHASYEIVSPQDQWQLGSSIPVLGQPARIVRCNGFDIYDYAGTSGETKLDETVKRTAEEATRSHLPSISDGGPMHSLGSQ
jgi:hypothetical protein